MSRSLVNTIARAMNSGSTRRSFLKRVAVSATALSVAPTEYILHPVTAYAAICGCAGTSCNCGSSCCDGYTEFCCTLNGGVNACPTGTFAGGWWKADGSIYCQGPRYYIDCMAECTTCSNGCGPGAFCASNCDNTSCTCGGGSCNNRRAGCTAFRYGQCHQEIACSGRISCRVASCTPPWILDSTCTTVSQTDDTTANHNVPCLQGPPPLRDLLVVAMVGPGRHSEVHVLDGTDSYQRFKLEVVSILGPTNFSEWAFTRGGADTGGTLDVVAVRMDGGNRHTEVHVLDGSDNYQRFKLEVISILGSTTPEEWAFTCGAQNGNGLVDLVAVRMDGGGGHTEVHVLDGSNNYQTFRLEILATLGATRPNEWKFTSGAKNANGMVDVIAVRMDGADGHTEVHVLNGGDNYQSFKLEVVSILGTTNPLEWTFTAGDSNGNGLHDVVAVRMDGADGHTEVHVLNGGDNYQSFKLEVVSTLGTTSPSQWYFPA